MVPISDLPSVAILRIATDDGGRLAVWRDGRMLVPETGPSLGALAAGTIDEVRAWFESVSGVEVDPSAATIVAPIDDQEVWGAGVTYRRSLDARAEESGRQAMYDHVYRAPRAELFYKSSGRDVAGWGGRVSVRSDSTWTVPEPELAVLATSGGETIAFAVGNDMTARDIEGENPLYLPQAKIYDGSCAIGPAAVPVWAVEPGTISMTVDRDGDRVLEGSVEPSNMVRAVADLLRQILAWHRCPAGVWLLTGTGIVPPDDFALRRGDEVTVAIEGLGALRNRVAVTGPASR